MSIETEQREEIKALPEETSTEPFLEELPEAASEESEEEWAPKTKRPRHGLLRRILIVLAFLLLTVSLLLVATTRLLAPEDADGELKETNFLLGELVDVSQAEYSYEDMEADLLALQKNYPLLIRVASAGKSLDGREIYYADIGEPDAPKQIFLSAGIHGREYLTPLLLMKMVEYHLINYYTEDERGVTFSDLTQDYLIRVVPMINPDGIMLSQQGLSAIRSQSLRETVKAIYQSDCEKYASYQQYGSLDHYLRYWKANAAGTDLNRNFPIDYWEELRTGIGQPSAQSYKGDQAGSEPETQAVMKLLSELKNPQCVLSIHSQGEVLYWKCGQTGSLLKQNERLTEALAELTGYSPQKRFTNPDATLDDWAALSLGIPSVNVETGKGSCPLPIEQFETIWGQTRGLWRCLLTFAP